MLSDDDRRRIEEEETLREQVRRILREESRLVDAERNSTRGHLRRVGEFLQTSLGTALLIWLLSSVVVTGLVKLQETMATNRETAKTIDRLHEELIARFVGIYQESQHVLREETTSNTSRRSFATYLDDSINLAPSRTENILKYPNVYPEYRDHSLFAVLAILRRTSDDEDRWARDASYRLMDLTSEARAFRGNKNPSSHSYDQLIIHAVTTAGDMTINVMIKG